MIAAVFLVGTGVGSVLPIMPLFLRERGNSYALVGVVVSASLAAQVLGQYPLGRLSDRLGRAPLMVGGLLLTGAAIGAFALPVSIWWLIVFRFLQGAGAAAFRPGSRAAVADLVPEGERGIAYGWLTGADMAGLIFGPALGGLLAIFGRSLVFELTGLAMFIAAGVVAFTLRSQRLTVSSTPERPSAERAVVPAGARAALRGVAMLTISIGFLYGVYNVVWSLFMKAIGASDWVVGLSFSLFALPLVLTAPLAGWASDHLDRRWLASGSTAITALLAPVYPLLQNIPAVIGVGAIEASSAAFGEPAMNAYLMSSVSPAQRGQALGTVGTADAAAKGVGALLGGWLFGLGIGVPFVVSSLVGTSFILLALPALRQSGRDPQGASTLAIAPRG